jgi:hypothetical protein
VLTGQSSLPPQLARLYGTAAWRRRRIRQLEAEPLCRACLEQKRLTPATVADHISRATDERSFREGPLQSLCHQHHQSKRQAERDGTAWQPKSLAGCAADGTPLDPTHHWCR